MTDGQVLLLTVAVLSVFESLSWTPPAAWLFVRGLFGIHRHVATTSGPDTLAGVPIFLGLWPRVDALHLAQPLPFVPLDDALLVGSLLSLPGTRPSPAAFRVLGYEALGAVSTDGAHLVLAGPKLRLRTASKRAAHTARRLIEELRSLSPERRRTRIEAFRRASIDLAALEVRRALLERFGTPVVWASRALALLLWVAIPVAAFVRGFSAVWIPSVASVLAGAVVVAALWLRAVARILPEIRRELRFDVLSMVLCPPVALRAADRISAELYADAHPAALAALLLPADAAAETLAALLRELDHPLVLASDPPERSRLQALLDSERLFVETFLRSRGLDPQALRRVDPASFPQGTRAFCPRCLDPLTVLDRPCPSCTLATVPLPF